MTPVLGLLGGVISGAGNDWWWPNWLLIGVALASLAWTYYARHRWPEADGRRGSRKPAD